ncbi:ATP-binding protein [Streptomyces marianii]|uniref:ATP-binding protein n=1 Tax=Streptomyces marianii TaxID=1817406 RepID=A0A5R9ECT6_9ACTN|nr:ATP-binding protein [Streptomyces marianii]TLQ47816.1 ATP-binding protein [Streptomyces marianii]
MTAQTIATRDEGELLLQSRFHAAVLARVRIEVDLHASMTTLTEQRRAHFVLAAHEVMCNAVRHGGGEGTLRLYRSADGVCCQVTDEGPGLSEDMIPRTLPSPDVSNGRGLWLVRELTDRLEIARHAAGTSITFAMGLDAA